jgi:hypothetical protein
MLPTAQKPLAQIVAEKPFHDYADWWPVGAEFLSFMSKAIAGEWLRLPHNSQNLKPVQDDLAEYTRLVYGRQAGLTLAWDFFKQNFSGPIYSGEFDALSYAFFKSAFELIERHIEAYEQPLTRERRLFTKRVGQTFFGLLHEHLGLDLPEGLDNEEDFDRLKACIERVGVFLKAQGYLRDHFAFSFRLDVEHAGRRIVQTEAETLPKLKRHGLAYALYEMGYPAILPSAVYLYHTIGEAQHHSSRTIEELFERVGYEARETDDFDPTGYPSERVVELWEIKKR